jgi:hypothetical protein
MAKKNGRRRVADPNLPPPPKLSSGKRSNSSPTPLPTSVKKPKSNPGNIPDPTATIVQQIADDFPTSDDDISTTDMDSTSQTNNSVKSSTSSQINRQPSPKTTDNLPIQTMRPHTIRTQPIIMSVTSWRQAAPLIYSNPDFTPDCITAITSSDGKIQVQTTNVTHFRKIQSFLLSQKIDFYTWKLPEERTLKVVLKGVPIAITTEEITSELEQMNFKVQLVKRFGPAEKPLPICLVILSLDEFAKEIYNISNLFYIRITVQAYKNRGPSQCFNCQRFGHGSQYCGHPPRCVKCAGPHKANECPKTRE